MITAVAGKTVSQGVYAHGLPADGDLLQWRSQDDGKTWSEGMVINMVICGVIVPGRFRYTVWLAQLMEPLITPSAERKMVADLAHLKSLIEARQ